MNILLILFTAIAFTSAPISNTATHMPENAGGAYLVIDGKFGGEITYAEIARHTELGIEGCVAGARIYKFTLVVTRSGKSESFTGKSSELTRSMLSELKSLAKGDSFTFEKVRARLGDDDDIIVTAKPFTIA